MMKISNCDDSNVWNDFLKKEQDEQMITIAHNPSLGAILSKTFGYKSQNLVLKKDDKIVGVMPKVVVGKKVVSVPHFSYGGPVIASGEAVGVNLNEIVENKKFEIRGFSKMSEHVYDKKISCVLKLHDTVDEQFMSVKSKLRQKIRKTQKMNFRTQMGGLELLNDFYHIYSRKMLEFGSPPIGKVFFKNLITDYKFGEAIITVVYDADKGDRIIAAGMCLSYLNFNEVCWSTTDSSYNRFNIHPLICWEMIKDSVEKKHTYFSFGRSTIDSNNHKFKKQWKPLELPIYYSYSEPIGTSIKELEFLTKIWKLQPLKTSVYFGHLISKYVY